LPPSRADDGCLGVELGVRRQILDMLSNNNKSHKFGSFQGLRK
jgi:hypothetical protein